MVSRSGSLASVRKKIASPPRHNRAEPGSGVDGLSQSGSETARSWAPDRGYAGHPHVGEADEKRI